MKINLEKILIKEFCERLPFNLAPFEKNGICKRPNEYCKYCKEFSKIYRCEKQTYTPINNKYSLT